MTWPRVSVSIISYQQREFVREAVESILAENYPDVEICIGDDGSTDGTHEMLREYEARFPSVMRLALSPVNRGVTANTNASYALCTGTYVAWLGGDDLFMPGKLHEQVALMESDPEIALSFHDLDVFDSETGQTLRTLTHGRARTWSAHQAARRFIENGVFCGSCSIMTRRSASPPCFDMRVPIASDWLFWIETAVQGRMAYLPKVLSRYRRHDRNLSSAPRHALEESFVTLAIVEARHPELVAAVRNRRARLLLHEALAAYRSGRRRRAITLAAEGVRLGGGGSARAFSRALLRTLRAR